MRPEEWAVGALEPESVEQVLDSIAQHGAARRSTAQQLDVAKSLAIRSSKLGDKRDERTHMGALGLSHCRPALPSMIS